MLTIETSPKVAYEEFVLDFIERSGVTRSDAQALIETPGNREKVDFGFRCGASPEFVGRDILDTVPAQEPAGLPVFTIDQCYNCAYWRTVVVQAPTLEVAIELANGANPGEGCDDPELEEPAILECGDWTSNGSGDECGPTFITNIAKGRHEYAWEEAKTTNDVPVPAEHRQFAVEWAGKLDAIKELRAALQNIVFNAGGSPEYVVFERIAMAALSQTAEACS